MKTNNATQPFLKAARQLGAGNDFAPGGAVLPRPSIAFATDATKGTYISAITLGDLAFQFAATEMLRASLHHVANNTDVQPIGTEFTYTITTDEVSGVVTILATLAAYANISFTITMTPLAEGYQIGFSTTTTNSTYAVEWIEFPRIGCQAPSGTATNAYLAHGFVGGLVSTTPHTLDLQTFDTAPGAPPSMQFWDYFDISTKAHLYISTDDDLCYPKLWLVHGDGISVTRQTWRHYFGNPRRTHNGSITMPMVTPYHVKMELFKGKTADGRCGFYDTAIRYRSYALGATRPWMVTAGGPWAASSSVSSRVKNSDFYYVRGTLTYPPGATHWTDTVQDMTRIQSFIGATHMIGLLYYWSLNSDLTGSTTFLPPALYPAAGAGPGTDLNTAIGTANAANVHLSFYTLPCFWETLLTGVAPFKYDDFLGTSDYNGISQYVLRDKDDLVQTPGGPFHPNQGLPFP